MPRPGGESLIIADDDVPTTPALSFPALLMTLTRHPSNYFSPLGPWPCPAWTRPGPLVRTVLRKGRLPRTLQSPRRFQDRLFTNGGRCSGEPKRIKSSLAGTLRPARPVVPRPQVSVRCGRPMPAPSSLVHGSPGLDKPGPSTAAAELALLQPRPLQPHPSLRAPLGPPPRDAGLAEIVRSAPATAAHGLSRRVPLWHPPGSPRVNLQRARPACRLRVTSWPMRAVGCRRAANLRRVLPAALAQA